MAPSPPVLVALLDGRVVGAVHRGGSGALRFVYDDVWRLDPDAYPLSLSMPLTAAEHGDRAITPFLWGLLPDSERTLERYGRLFGVSARSPVQLLAHIGADCAGAVQFAEPHRAAALVGAAPRPPAVDWLTDADVARELRSARELGVAGDSARTVGQFSLAGAQPKIALFGARGRWGRPRGRTPTTHILKPPAGDHAGIAANEHFCLDLAARLGLSAVRSRVLRFDDEIAIVVDRFDRARAGPGEPYRRIHQEDVCQALAVMPDRKYENQGGPGVADVVRLLRESSREPVADVERFLRLVMLDWVLAATDAHAKNYALLHGPRRDVRLAPFYDVISDLPYDRSGRLHRVKLAMSVDGEYLVRRVGRSHWEALARVLGMRPAAVLDMLSDVLLRLPDAVEATRAEAVRAGVIARHVNALARRVTQRTAACAGAIAVAPPRPN